MRPSGLRWRSYANEPVQIKYNKHDLSVGQSSSPTLLVQECKFRWAALSCWQVMFTILKYSDVFTLYHSCKIWTGSFYYLFICPQSGWLSGKYCRLWSNAMSTFCGIWSGSALFAKAYLSKYSQTSVTRTPFGPWKFVQDMRVNHDARSGSKWR